MGSSLAEANDLGVGDTFTMNGETYEVIGLFETGTQFGDNALFCRFRRRRPCSTATGEVDEAVVRADSVDNVEQVATGPPSHSRRRHGGREHGAVPFSNISAPGQRCEGQQQDRASFAALIASAAVILVSVGLVARQRIKEIGILKAVGASGWHVTAQFGVETAFVAIVAALLGALPRSRSRRRWRTAWYRTRRARAQVSAAAARRVGVGCALRNG